MVSQLRVADWSGLPAASDRALVNDWQRGFPLVGRPFAELATALGSTESGVIDACRRLVAEGVVSRIGPVYAPGALGAGALAALAVPAERLEAVAALVSAEPGVNHNYEREHRFNLWFVITGVDRLAVRARVEALAARTGCEAIFLPLVAEYHIDLGFDLAGVKGAARALAQPRVPRDATAGLEPRTMRLMAALQAGLPLVPEPFRALGERVGWAESEVIEAVARALDDGMIRRFGVVVRHHELGIGANAMCVWEVPESRVDELGCALARAPEVTLCYRRSPDLPRWRYTLYCMIHGSARGAVLEARDRLAASLGLDAHPSAVLFSGRRFKQRGARYLPAREEAVDAR